MSRGLRTVGRHAVGRTRHVWGGVFRTIGVMVLVVAISSVSVAAYATWHLQSQFKDGGVDIGGEPPSIAAIDGAFNVLLVGADNAPGQKSWGAKRDGTLNDVNILVHVAANHKSASVISIPRDLVIPHPQCTDPKTGTTYPAMSAQPINTAYSRGGLACVVGTVESLTGLTIPYAAVFSFQGTVKMADAVGGVDVCVNQAINDPDSGLVLKKGVSTISGRTALAYLRSRHGVGDGSDLSRIGSQQAYMSSLLRKMTSAGTLSDPTKLYGLASAAAKYVTLSESLTDIDTIVQMALALKGMNLSRMVFVQYPVGEDPYDRNKVIPNTALAAELMDRVQRDKRIVLDKDSLGPSVTLADSTSKSTEKADSTDSPTPKPTKTKKPSTAIAGLKGRTAAQQTCSLAYGTH